MLTPEVKRVLLAAKAVILDANRNGFVRGIPVLQSLNTLIDTDSMRWVIFDELDQDYVITSNDSSSIFDPAWTDDITKATGFSEAFFANQYAFAMMRHWNDFTMQLKIIKTSKL